MLYDHIKEIINECHYSVLLSHIKLKMAESTWTVEKVSKLIKYYKARPLLYDVNTMTTITGIKEAKLWMKFLRASIIIVKVHWAKRG